MTSAVVFPIGTDYYAVDADTVGEVVSDVRPTRLPTAPLVYLGVFNLRGEVVPVFDTAALLGFSGLEYNQLGQSGLAIVVRLPPGQAGLMVSALPKMETLGAQVGRSELRGTSGAFDTTAGVAVLLDVGALLLPHTGVGVGSELENAGRA